MESTRRQFLIAAGVLALAGVVPRRVRAQGSEHPKPRPGITAAKVLGPAELGDDAELLEVFNQVRQIPQVVDGIRCHCGCAEMPNHYSLLSCYEGDGMARFCEICRGEGKLAFELHQKGQTLDAIRIAIDRKFG